MTLFSFMQKIVGVLTFALFVSCTTVNAQAKYIEIREVSNISEIEFSNLSDFEKFATGDIFFCQINSKAYVLVGNTYYSYNLQGYKTIADYKYKIVLWKWKSM